jgi:hypothetical protein
VRALLAPLDPTGEPQAEGVDELGRKLAESFGDRMELVGPFSGRKRALRIDQDEVVGRISRELYEHLPEVAEGVIEDGGAVGLVAGELERGLEPGTGTWRMAAVGDGEVVTVADDGNAGGVGVAKSEEVEVRRRTMSRTPRKRGVLRPRS